MRIDLRGRWLLGLLLVCGHSWALNITASRSISGPDTSGALMVTIEVDIATDAGEEGPSGVIVSEYVPLNSTVTRATPAYNYYRESTGEIAWLFMGEGGVSTRTVSYSFVPVGGHPTPRGVVISIQNEAIRRVPIEGGHVAPSVGYGSVRGIVRNARTGETLEVVSVSVGGKTASSDSAGAYEVRSLPIGEHVLQANLAGYLTSRVGVTIQRGQTVVQNIQLVQEPTAQPRPVVISVQPQFEGVYLDGISFPNRYTASVSWNGQPGTVVFQANGTRYTEPGSSAGASHTFDMGRDFKGSLYASENNLTVIAQNAAGQESEPYTIHPFVVPTPVWLQHPFVFTAIAGSGGGSFEYEFRFPEPPFDANVTLPSVIPSLGGHTFGISKAQVEFEWVHNLDGSGNVSLGLEGGGTKDKKPIFAAGPAKVNGDLEGGGGYSFYPGSGFVWDEVFFGFGVSAEIGPPVIPELLITDFIPGLQGVGRLPGINWFTERAKVGMKVKPDIELKAYIDVQPDGRWELSRGEGEGSVRIKLVLTLKVLDNLKAELYGGGTPKITFQVPADPGYLKRLSMELFAGVEITVWFYQEQFEASYTFVYPPEAGKIALKMVPGSLRSSGLKPIERNYLDTPNYSRFVANQPQAVGKGSPLAVKNEQTTAERMIIENVYPYSEPSLAANGSEKVLLFVYDDPNDPLFQNTEIYNTRYTDGSWSQPQPILNDTRGEFNPQVQFDGNGNAIAVWERIKNENLEAPDLTTLSANMEIVWSKYDGTAWSAPLPLTDNDYLDHAPKLRAGTNGTLMLVWTENEGNEITATAESPGRLLSKTWNGSAWSETKTCLDGVAGVVRPDVAYSGSGGIVVYTLDGDGDLSTVEDEDLYAVVWDGTGWHKPQRLTENGLPDTSARIVFSPDGEPILVWEQGESLMMRRSLEGEDAPVGAEGIVAGIVDYQLTIDNAGNLVILWQDDSPEGTDVFYAVYDAAHERWSKTLQLTADEAVEQDFAALFDPSDSLQMAYNKVQIEYVDRGGDTGETPTKGQTDLYVLEHTLGENLMIAPDSIVLSTANPMIGSSVIICASLVNSGDAFIESVQAAFYDGEATYDNQIGEVITLEGLDAGEASTIHAQWTVPIENRSHTITAMVDPDNKITEKNETDNSVSIETVLPDLNLTGVTARKSPGTIIDLLATVQNGGAIRSTTVTVVFERTGSGVIDSTDIGPLEPGEGETVQVMLDTAGIEFTPENREVMVTVQIPAETDDWDIANNKQRLLLPVEVEPVKVNDWDRY